MACRKVIFMTCILAILYKIDICYPDTAIENVFVETARKVGPAVVRIVTKHAPSEFEQMDVGSGMIIDTEGYILTADFAVTDAEDIKVILPDRREFKGEIKGRDKKIGVAVIKISAKGLPTVEFGDSNALKVRQFVMASCYHGNESSPTFTVGVVSALHRSLLVSNRYEFNDLIQTDAGMKAGFGGGPLVDTDKKVVGMILSELTPGVGYAIPINRVRNILESLKLGNHQLDKSYTIPQP